MASPESSERPALLAGEMVALDLVAALAAGGAWFAVGYGLWNAGEPGPGLFPLIVCAATIACSMLSLAALAAGSSQQPAAANGESNQEEGPILWGKLSIYIGTVLVWPWLLSPLGFLVSSAIALTLIVRFAEGSSWGESAVLVACVTAIGWLVFGHLLGVPLPKGLIGFG